MLNQTEYIKAVIAARNDQSKNSIPYQSMIDDCWSHVFDFLSPSDILQMSQTCTHMQRVCGEYLVKYFPRVEYHFKKEQKMFGPFPKLVEIRSDFCKYIGALTIRAEGFDDSSKNVERFSSLKSVKFDFMHEISKHRNLLKSIEDLELNGTNCADSAFKEISSNCQKLKKLRVRFCRGNVSAVFEQYFPTLEYFYIYQHFEIESGLECFLNKHKTLKHLVCEYTFLWENREWFFKTIAQLDEITVILNVKMHEKGNVFFDMLKRLFHQGFYKRLTLSLTCDFGYNGFETMTKLIVDLSQSVPLKKLCLHGEIYQAQTDYLANNLPTLEEVDLLLPLVSHIESFIYHSRSVKNVRAGVSSEIQYFEKLNINKLNEGRKKLMNAFPIVLQLNESQYLKVKHREANMDLSHIQIRQMSRH